MRHYSALLLGTISTIILLFNCHLIYAWDIPTHFPSSPPNVFDTSSITIQETTISSSGPDITRAKKYVYLTGASYCFNVSNWDCEYCKKANSLGYEYFSSVSNASTNTFGFMVVNKEVKEIVVVFRGSYNVANVLQDVTLTQGNPGVGESGSDSTIKVHGGFLEAANSLYPQVVKQLGALVEDNKDYNVIITGHSLGAAIASLTLYMLLERINVPSNFVDPSYAFFGYAESRVGNQAYADFWNNQKIPVTRIVSKRDIVPHVPPANMGFVHHGTELWITPTDENKVCSKTIYEDPTCSNSIGPAYSPSDHPQYWDVNHAFQCSLKDPVAVLSQFVLPFQGPTSGS